MDGPEVRLRTEQTSSWTGVAARQRDWRPYTDLSDFPEQRRCTSAAFNERVDPAGLGVCLQMPVQLCRDEVYADLVQFSWLIMDAFRKRAQWKTWFITCTSVCIPQTRSEWSNICFSHFKCSTIQMKIFMFEMEQRRSSSFLVLTQFSVN